MGRPIIRRINELYEYAYSGILCYKEHIGRGRLVCLGRGAKQTLVGVHTILRVYTGSLYYITCLYIVGVYTILRAVR